MSSVIDELGFHIETRNGARVKVRSERHFGPCVGDEARLWDVLQDTVDRLAMARIENEDLRQKLQAGADRIAGQSEALSQKAMARIENEDLRQKLRAAADCIAGQSEALSQKAERKKRGN